MSDHDTPRDEAAARPNGDAESAPPESVPSESVPPESAPTDHTRPDSVGAAGDAAGDGSEQVPPEPPVSSSWATVTAPWGTPGNHLTGPIPRIRRRGDGSLTHGEES